MLSELLYFNSTTVILIETVEELFHLIFRNLKSLCLKKSGNFFSGEFTVSVDINLFKYSFKISQGSLASSNESHLKDIHSIGFTDLHSFNNINWFVVNRNNIFGVNNFGWRVNDFFNLMSAYNTAVTCKSASVLELTFCG